MPLVEENRKLHAANLLLREELTNLNVRLDTLMETPFNYRGAIRHLVVEVDPLSVHLEPRDRCAQVTRDLSSKMLNEAQFIAKRVQMNPLGMMELRFAFLSWGK